MRNTMESAMRVKRILYNYGVVKYPEFGPEKAAVKSQEISRKQARIARMKHLAVEDPKVLQKRNNIIKTALYNAGIVKYPTVGADKIKIAETSRVRRQKALSKEIIKTMHKPVRQKAVSALKQTMR